MLPHRRIDYLDPCYAPGTGTPAVLSTKTLHIIRGLQGIKLVGMVLVEVTPAYDVNEMTALAGASIALDLLCLFAANKQASQPA
ncbi:arginase family protein [Dasania marina]|uniref:arginase family protein n=1 Tax=Dasania marina TaxID=471499 RepID=UPI0030DA7612